MKSLAGRLGYGALIGLAALVVAGLGLWGFGALWFRTPLGEAARLPLALMWGLGAVLALAGLFTRWRWRGIGAFAIGVAVLLGWWSTLVPSNSRDWAPDVARTPTASIDGNILTIRNVRNFDWRSATDATERWEERSYDLSKLTSIDLYASHWDGEAIAHTLVSFGFSDGRYLTWSIELRRLKGQVFSTLAGFFKESELVYVAADERDIIRLRTTLRGEDVRLYRLMVPPEVAREALLAYVQEANALAAAPRWYNTALTNCTTVVFRIARLVHAAIPLDWRVLLSGYFPDFAYDYGALDRSLPFTELRQRSHISQRAIAADALSQPAFSQTLRRDIPGIPQPVATR